MIATLQFCIEHFIKKTFLIVEPYLYIISHGYYPPDNISHWQVKYTLFTFTVIAVLNIIIVYHNTDFSLAPVMSNKLTIN